MRITFHLYLPKICCQQRNLISTVHKWLNSAYTNVTIQLITLKGTEKYSQGAV